MSGAATSTVRILLVDDHTLFRESLGRLLEAEEGLEVVAHCGSGVEAVRIVKTYDIDMILLDLDLGPEKGADLLENLRSAHFEGKVLLVTASVNERDVPDFIRKGISGIFMKHNSPALLIQGIREAMAGKVWFEQDLLRKAMEAARFPPSPTELTKRERQVLSFVFRGLSNKEISDRIQLSESAVKGCLQNLFAKTGVRTRSQLVRVALEQYRDQL